jgi:hypothetical protein
MNTRIEKDFYFQTGLHYNDAFWINSYEITLSMLVEVCDNPDEPSIAVERVSHYLKSIIQSSLLIDENEQESIDKYEAAGLRVCKLPAAPHDEVFASLLILKLNAIMEGRVKITDLILGSEMSEGVRYNIVSEVAESCYSGDTWWNKSDLSICNEEPIHESNVVKLFDDNEWTELELGWK